MGRVQENKVIAICRFSVVTHENKKLAGNNAQSWQEYKSSILDSKKLKDKLSLFSSVTLPSIEGNTVKPAKSLFRFVLLISKDIPKRSYSILLKITARYEWCKIVPLAEDENINDALISNLN